jgi:hypothetical protein
MLPKQTKKQQAEKVYRRSLPFDKSRELFPFEENQDFLTLCPIPHSGLLDYISANRQFLSTDIPVEISYCLSVCSPFSRNDKCSV